MVQPPANEPAPSQPPASQLAPSQLAPSQPAPSQPAPSQPAPSQPAPSQPDLNELAAAGEGHGLLPEDEPASEAMSEETARYYERHTGGQLRAFRHPDGNWYLAIMPADPSHRPDAPGMPDIPDIPKTGRGPASDALG